MNSEIQNDWANAASPHELGLEAASKLTISRQRIAEFLDCDAKSLSFTSGATESINTVLHPFNIRTLGIEQVVSSRQEHSATLACLRRLEEYGMPVVWIGANSRGQLDLADLEAKLKGKRSLVSLMYVNNETGVINDVFEINRIVSAANSLLHVDASQALGKVKFSLTTLAADFVSLSGHKVGSLKGIGMLVARANTLLAPFVVGGKQEDGFRAGTANLPAVRSLELAIDDIDFGRLEHIARLRDEFEAELTQLHPEVRINGLGLPRVSNTSNVYFASRDSQELLFFLSRNGVCASNGSACNSGAVEPSHVITSLGFDKKYARSCVRFSLGPDITIEQIKYAVSTIQEFLAGTNEEFVPPKIHNRVGGIEAS